MARLDLGVDYRRLRRSSVAAGIGDGMVATALPLLAAGVTRDPVAVAGVIAAQHVPWVIVALLRRTIGVSDRRTVLGAADTVRAVTVGLLGVLALAGQETILGIQLVAAVVGFGEALTDDAEAEAALVLAPAREAVSAGGGLSSAGMSGLALVGLPLGGVLFELLGALPLLADVLVFAVAALFALSLRARVVVEPVATAAAPAAAPSPLPHLRLDPGSRVVTAVAVLATAASSAVLGVLVLFALDDLGLGAPAFGLLLAGLAAAAVVGGLLAPDAGRLLGLRGGLIAGLLGTGAGQAGAALLADPARPEPAVLALGVAAGSSMVAAVLARAVLQGGAGFRRGDVGLETFHLAVWASIPVGAVAGGIVGRSLAIDEVVLGAGAVSAAAAVLALALPRKSG